MAEFLRVPVAPETMHPALTRGSLGSRQRLRIELYATRPSDFIQSDEGIWLPPLSVVERDKLRAAERLHALAENVSAEGLEHITRLARKTAGLIERSRITAEGCIIGGLRGPQKAGRYLLELAEKDWGAPTFDTIEDLEHIQLCATTDCINTRHYDFEFSRATLRERKVELDTDYYEQQANGEIRTVWGDTLPDPSVSWLDFMKFIKQCYPYVPDPSSPLSPVSVSQLRFVPQTGCWESWQYYCKPEFGKSWQFDGYGRLNTRMKIRSIDANGEIAYKRTGHMLAHRVVWWASGRRLVPGRVLNHLCGYRRCCNPLHLEQVSSAENTRHGKIMQEAKRSLISTS